MGKALNTVLSVFVFGLLFPNLVAFAEPIDRILAIVNKTPILLSDVAYFKKTIPLRQKVDPFYSSSDLAQTKNKSLEQYVDYLIGEELIKSKFNVQDVDVEQEINSIQSNLKIDRSQLKLAIQAEGFSFEEYFKLMKMAVSKRQLLDREIRSRAAISDDDIKNVINQEKLSHSQFNGSFHLYLIRTNDEASIKNAFSELSKGASFSEVAKKYNTSTSEQGGDLGFLSYADLSPVLQKSVRTLKLKKHSPIIKDGKSFIILQVDEIKSDDSSITSHQRETIRAQLMEKEFQKQIHLWIQRQKTVNYIQINAS